MTVNGTALNVTFSGQNLSCVRGERLVLEDLSFDVAAGDALVLRGPNGSGKSTLLRLAAGFLKPAEGRLIWRDENEPGEIEEFRDRMHYVGHLDAVKPAFTVSENLAFWAAFEGSDNPGDDAALGLERLGLSRIADVPGRYLSAGQRRRLNIARIAAIPKPLWLLDEPSVSLDTDAVALLAGLIAEHRAGGGMVMVATHIDLGVEDGNVLRLDEARTI